MLKSAVVGYGRIVRDEEGNVIDIIMPEEEETGVVAQETNEDAEEEVKHVEAKTDVVRCECLFKLMAWAVGFERGARGERDTRDGRGSGGGLWSRSGDEFGV